MKKGPLIVLILIVIVVGIMIIAVSVKTSATVVSADELSFSDIRLSETSFFSKVSFTSSGKTFRRYKYKIEQNNLYITVYGGLANMSFPDGSFEIAIQDSFNDVNAVYLQSGDTTTRIFPTE